VATFNVENLDPGDPQSKFDTLAGLIVHNLRAPDLISVEEVQDDNGPTDDGVVDASQTFAKLIAAVSAAGGPTYEFRSIDPANHSNAKGGDNPLMGRFQPPRRSSEAQRHQQAQLVHDFVAQILGLDPSARVVVLGDLNDFEFSDTVHILEGGGALSDLSDTLPQNERYSYVFEGNSQDLDHVLVSPSLTGKVSL